MVFHGHLCIISDDVTPTDLLDDAHLNVLSTEGRILRSSSLQLLHSIVCCLGEADALAFFVPGLVSGLSKQLLAPGGSGRTSGYLNNFLHLSTHLFHLMRDAVCANLRAATR